MLTLTTNLEWSINLKRMIQQYERKAEHMDTHKHRENVHEHVIIKTNAHFNAHWSDYSCNVKKSQWVIQKGEYMCDVY